MNIQIFALKYDETTSLVCVAQNSTFSGYVMYLEKMC